MKAKMINTVKLEGLLYEHKLELKVTGENSKKPGTEYITGTISIATDNAITNIVEVHFTYITAVTSNGKSDSRFTVLKNILEGKTKSVMKDGKDNAVKIRIDSAIGLNDFYTDKDGVETLVSAKRNEGGFIHPIDELNEDEKARSRFECDMIITNVRHMDADPERNLPEKAIIRGAIFDFRKALLPVEFSAVAPGAIGYFESLDASAKNPVFTKVWGSEISETVTRTYEEESAFGEANVREVKSSRKDFVITGASREPYAWNDESTITEAELTKAMADRETYLATIKQRRTDYLNSQNGGSANTIASGGFKF